MMDPGSKRLDSLQERPALHAQTEKDLSTPTQKLGFEPFGCGDADRVDQGAIAAWHTDCSAA